LIRIGLLAFDGCQEGSLTAALDVFRVFEAIASYYPALDVPSFELVFVSVGGGDRRTAGGMAIPTRDVDPSRIDALIAPGVHHHGVADLMVSLGGLGDESRLLATVAKAGKPVLAACSAVFLMAAGGALAGRRATTSWWLAPALSEACPEALVDAQERVVADGPCISAAGVTSNHDLALWLVRRFAGEELQRACAKFLLLDLDRQAQSQFVIESLIERPQENLLAKARAWLNDRLTEPVRVEELARHCGLSQRSLLRRFRETARLTPARYLQTLRLERAKALLEETDLSAAAVAARCGYADTATFRKTFKLRIRLTPQQYRTRFGRRADGASFD
jgi:transcriptional regulator GlxA family with amidase domain